MAASARKQTPVIHIAWTMTRPLIAGEAPRRRRAPGHGRVSGDEVVESVPLSGDVAGGPDQALELRAGRAAVRPGGLHHVLLDHGAAHVVGSELERDLADFLALGDPRGLDVRHVVEEQAADRLGAQVLRARDLPAAESGVLR